MRLWTTIQRRNSKKILSQASVVGRFSTPRAKPVWRWPPEPGWKFWVGKAPALAQTKTLHILEWSSFVKEADVERDRQAAEFGKQAGVKVTVEHINANDLPARATAAIEGGKGPDILQLLNNSPHLYAGGLEDHSKLLAELGGEQFYPFFRAAAQVDGRLSWRAQFLWGWCQYLSQRYLSKSRDRQNPGNLGRTSWRPAKS